MSALPPLISVVTPVRNGERYLAEAIESVLGQTLPAWEYVIVDGCSTDRSRAIAEACAEREPRIRVLSEPDGGMYDALLKGLERTAAPLCCWINADDRFMPWAFELVARYVRLSGAAWVTGVPACMDRDGLVHTVDALRWYPRRLIRAGLCHGSAFGFIQQEGTFFARRLLEGLEQPALARVRASRLAGDTFLWRAFAGQAALEIIPTVLGAFRWHGGNLTADDRPYYRELEAAGYPMPPALLASGLKALCLPLAVLEYKRRLRRWRALWPDLFAGATPAAGRSDAPAGALPRRPVP